MPCLADALRPEDDPADHHQHERQHHLTRLLERGQHPALGHLIRVLPVPPQQNQRQEQQGVIRAPRDERPVRTVPETAHKEDHERVPHHPRLRHPAPAQRNVHIVPEPRRQRNVPPTPKLSYVPAEVRHVEVAHQPYPEQLRRTDGDVAVARKVAIDLKREEHRAQEQRATALRIIRREHLVHIHRAVVRHDHLLEQTPQYLPHPVNRRAVVELPLLQELRKQVGRPLDGTRHQLRKERDECEKRNNVTRRLHLAPIHVYRVRQRLERVERDANRQYHPQQQAVRREAEQPRKLRDKEVVVLEHRQDAEVEHDVQPHPPPRAPPRPRRTDKQAAAPRAERREGDQQQEAPVPPAVEHVARHYHERVLRPQTPPPSAHHTAEDIPIEHEHYRQKHRKLYRIE